MVKQIGCESIPNEVPKGMYAPKLIVTTTVQSEPQPDPSSDAAVLEQLVDLLLVEFPELIEEGDRSLHIVELFRRKLALLKALSIIE